jgi:uncharacterized membrane protein (UPF0136 family)
METKTVYDEETLEIAKKMKADIEAMLVQNGGFFETPRGETDASRWADVTGLVLANSEHTAGWVRAMAKRDGLPIATVMTAVALGYRAAVRGETVRRKVGKS